MTESLSKSSSGCPTRSLREYLAHQSVHQSEPTDPDSAVTLDIVVEIGDGRKETLSIGDQTNIDREAQLFCKKYNLDPFVKDLLAETIRSQYQMEFTQRQNQRQAELVEELRQIYTNNHAKEVLIAEQQSSSPKAIPLLAETNVCLEAEDCLWKTSTDDNKQNQPVMNSVSRLICEKYGKENIIDWQSKRSQQRMETLKRQKLKREEADLRECLFKPKINAISQKVDNQLKESSLRYNKKQERYERLYQNYQEIECRKKQLKDRVNAELSFKPNINFISKKIVQNKKYLESSKSPNRNGQTHTNCREKDCTNRPKTGRKPQNRNTGGLPIGDYLYQQAKRHSKPEIYQMKYEIKALPHSDNLVAALKEKKLKQMFIELSLPPHQILAPQDIPSNDQIQHTSLRILGPLLSQIQSLGFSLNQMQFIEAGMSLIDSLAPEQKHELLFQKKPVMHQHHSFNSTQRGSISRQNSGDLYARGIVKTRQRDRKLKKSREAKVREELRYCTFRPALKR